MPDVPWTYIGVGGSSAIATLLVVSYLAGRAWNKLFDDQKGLLTPIAHEVASKSIETMEEWQQYMRRADKRVDDQLAMCEQNTDTTDNINCQIQKQRLAWLELCRGLRVVAPACCNGNDQLKRQLIGHAEEIERILREAE